MNDSKTTPTEFNPTPEQVEEVKARFKTITQPLFSHAGIIHCLARYHLTELHRETETLRSQVERVDELEEENRTLVAAHEDMIANLKATRAERDALKAQVVVKDEAIKHALEASSDPEKWGRYLSNEDREILFNALA